MPESTSRSLPRWAYRLRVRRFLEGSIGFTDVALQVDEHGDETTEEGALQDVADQAERAPPGEWYPLTGR